MLDFKFLVLDKHDVIQHGIPVTVLNAGETTTSGALVFGVDASLRSTVGTLLGFDAVTGRSIVRNLQTGATDAYDHGYIIPEALAPQVLCLDKGLWRSARLMSVDTRLGVYLVTDTEHKFVSTVRAEEVVFLEQAAVGAHIVTGLGAPAQCPDTPEVSAPEAAQ